MAKELSRRQFFRLIPDRLMKSDQPSGQSEKQQQVCRPPGAKKDEREFLSTCQRCQDCSKACPFDAIMHLGPSFGPEENTPYMNIAENPCRWCEDMPCIHACSSGALAYENDGAVNPIAKVQLNLNACLVQQGIICDECAMVCPSHVKAIKMSFRKPQLDPDICVGCGLCVFHCAATPSAIQIAPK